MHCLCIGLADEGVVLTGERGGGVDADVVIFGQTCFAVKPGRLLFISDATADTQLVQACRCVCLYVFARLLSRSRVFCQSCINQCLVLSAGWWFGCNRAFSNSRIIYGWQAQWSDG